MNTEKLDRFYDHIPEKAITAYNIEKPKLGRHPE